MQAKHLLGTDLSASLDAARTAAPEPASTYKEPAVLALRKVFAQSLVVEDPPGTDVTEEKAYFLAGVEAALALLQGVQDQVSGSYGITELLDAVDEMHIATCILNDQGEPECL